VAFVELFNLLLLLLLPLSSHRLEISLSRQHLLLDRRLMIAHERRVLQLLLQSSIFFHVLLEDLVVAPLLLFELLNL